MAISKRSNMPGKQVGQIADKMMLANPMGGPKGDTDIAGMKSSKGSNSEMTGFVTEGYIDKQGTPYGEAAKFNFLPPGMDISNQENAEIHGMEMKTVVDMSYPGDGYGAPRDIPE